MHTHTHLALPISFFFLFFNQVPEEIAGLSRLRVLALDNNDLKTVPAAIGKLSRLQSLLLRCVFAKREAEVEHPCLGSPAHLS